MKLLIVLSVIACSYGDKLDRTYLPPESAATAGGSPGSLNAPSGPGGFGLAPGRGAGANGFQPSGSSAYRAPSGNSAFGQSSGPSAFGQSSGASTFGQSSPSGFGQSGPQGGQVSGASNYGQAPSGFDQQSAGGRGNAFNQGAQGQSAFSGQGFQQPERAQASADQSAQILRYENENDGETFSYAFETSNGISAEESGVATNGVQAQGGYSYTGDDGQNYRVTYTADENGYQPQGDHLPTPPPVPEEILRSIEKNAAAAAAGIQEGAYNPDEDESVSGQQYSANGGYSGGPAAYNQPQGGRPGQQAFGSQGAGMNQNTGAGAYNQPGSAYNQGGAVNQQGGAYNQQGPNNFSAARPSQSQGSSGRYNQNQGPAAAQFNQGAQGFSGQNGGSQSQGDNGYEYNRPANAQGSSGQFNRPVSQGAFPRPSSPAGPSQGSFGPQTYNQPAQSGPLRPSGSFSKPSGPATPSQGSFGPQTYTQSGPQPSGSAFPKPTGSAGSSQGAFRPQYNQQSQTGQAPSGSFPRPSGSSNGQYQSQAAGGTQGSAEGYQYNRPSQQGPQGAQSRPQSPQSGPQSSFGQGPKSSFGQGPKSFGQGPKSFGQGPQSSFGQSPQSSFGQSPQSSSAQGPKSSFGQGPKSSFGQSPQPGVGKASQSSFGQGPQRFQAPQGSQGTQGRGQSFEGPLQPASFSEQEGYKY